MGSGLHWTPEQLADYERRRDVALRDISRPVATVAKPAPKESKLERRFEQQLTDAGISGYQRNYFFLPERDFELDFAWAPIKVYVEIQGMSHRIKGKFRADIEKRALAMLAGWRGLELDNVTIKDGRGLQWLKEILSK